MYKLIKQYRDYFTNDYFTNDPAHREDHFEEVLENALKINRSLGFPYPKELYVHFAYSHDLMAWSRDDHHQLSSKFVLESNHPVYQDLTQEELQMVSDACLKHRSSTYVDGTYLYDTLFEEICACADRGTPKEVSNVVRRAIKYRMGRGHVYSTSTVRDAVDHVQEKYGDKFIYPPLYLRHYEEEMDKFFYAIDNLDVEEQYNLHMDLT